MVSNMRYAGRGRRVAGRWLALLVAAIVAMVWTTTTQVSAFPANPSDSAADRRRRRAGTVHRADERVHLERAQPLRHDEERHR